MAISVPQIARLQVSTPPLPVPVLAKKDVSGRPEAGVDNCAENNAVTTRLCSCTCAAGSFSPSDTQPYPCTRYDKIPTLSFHLTQNGLGQHISSSLEFVFISLTFFRV